jgi:hypothetical protein
MYTEKKGQNESKDDRKETRRNYGKELKTNKDER